MSGPKVSVYTLTEEELAQLLEEALREQQEIQRHNELLYRCSQCKSEIESMQDTLEELQKLAGRGGDWLKEKNLEAQLAQAQNELPELMKVWDRCMNLADNDLLESELSQLNGKLANIRMRLPKLQNKTYLLKQELEKTLGDKISELFLTEEPQDSNESEDEGNSEENIVFVRKSIEKLLELNKNTYLPPSCKASVEDAIERMKMANKNHYLKSFCSIELPDILKECQDFINLWERIGEEYRSLYMEYNAWLERNGNQARREMVPVREESLAKLHELIKAEKIEAQKQAEQAYIRTALDEVMTEMGYDVIGSRSVTKRSGKHFENKLFKYDGDTAVNITYADDGQIAMELGKLDGEDRVPTASEENQLENQMVHFCESFEELEKRLADKGISIGTRIALSPPSRDYAQIINVKDYETAESAKAERREKLQVKSPKAEHSE